MKKFAFLLIAFTLLTGCEKTYRIENAEILQVIAPDDDEYRVFTNKGTFSIYPDHMQNIEEGDKLYLNILRSSRCDFKMISWEIRLELKEIQYKEINKNKNLFDQMIQNYTQQISRTVAVEDKKTV